MSEHPVWLSSETINRKMTPEEKAAISDMFVKAMFGPNKGDDTLREVKTIAMCAHDWVGGRR